MLLPERGPLLVLLGGVAGTPSRYGVAQLLPARPGTLPVATLLVNVVGGFLLGTLLEALARRGPDSGGRRQARLLVGTGFLGAFTTYSSLAVETDLLLRADAPGLAVAYALGSVVAGVLAAAAGVATARRVT